MFCSTFKILIILMFKMTVCRNVDPDNNHDFQLPNCIDVDPNDLLINQLSATTFSCLSLYISSLKKHFQTLQTEITDHFQPSVIGLCETKNDSNIEQLYNLQVIT